MSTKKKFKYANQHVKIMDAEGGETWLPLAKYMKTITQDELQPTPWADEETKGFIMLRVHDLKKHPSDKEYQSFRKRKLAHAHFTTMDGIWLQLPEAVSIERTLKIDMEKF